VQYLEQDRLTMPAPAITADAPGITLGGGGTPRGRGRVTAFNQIGLFLASHWAIAIMLAVLGLAAIPVIHSYRRRPDRGNVVRLRRRRFPPRAYRRLYLRGRAWSAPRASRRT
jgi:hypothetical protein